MKQVKKNLEQLLKKEDKIVVACSGGPDSMALLSILNELKEQYDLSIICAHVNHNKRVESKDEEKMVRKFCEENNIVFECHEIKEYTNENFEMQARKIRYSFFETIVKKYQANYLFTAHHGDDLIETVLMRLNRGSILKGYRGIDEQKKLEHYTIIRPFLSLSKEELLQYVKDNSIPYCIDQTNEEDNQTRNRFRHHVLPFLKKENPKVHLKYKEFSEELKQYDEFIEEYLKKNCEKIYNVEDKKIDISLFNQESEFIQIKLIEKILNDIYDGFLEYINKKHVKSILDLIHNSKSNQEVSLPKNYIGYNDYRYFAIKKRKDCTQYNYEFKNNIQVPGGEISKIESSDEKSNYIIRLSSDEVKLPLHVRTRLTGDKMEIKNFENAKKVSRIFTDEKISKDKRDEIPIVTDTENKVLWIPGVKKSKFDKEKDEKYDIILKYDLIKEENNE